MHSLNCRGRILLLDRPRILGVLNVTPDSFSDGGQFLDPAAAVAHATALLAEGADVLDIGGASSRPGAADVSADEEWARIGPVIEAIRARHPEALLSVDTWRADVAAQALAAGAHIINDITGGTREPDILRVAADAGAPYILMHMQGTPATMQQHPQYVDVVTEVYDFFVARLRACQAAGLHDVVLDPGFGFGKTLAHNHALLTRLEAFAPLGHPLLVGLSRKRMLRTVTGVDDALANEPALAAAHLLCLQQGAALLRVHAPAAARQVVQMHSFIRNGAV